MKIYHDFTDFIKVPNAIVTIGTFDGVHQGHRAILTDMVNAAKCIDGETVVITFYPHPRQVLNIDSANLRFITTQEEKIKQLDEIGIDNLIIVYDINPIYQKDYLDVMINSIHNLRDYYKSDQCC